MTDVVYVVRPGEWNEELRYSLRSLENLPHDRVIVVGSAPDWCKVDRIPTSPTGDKYQRASGNLIAACQDDVISDPFYFFNDDMYVMLPIEEVPVLHNGSLENLLKKRAKAKATLELLQSYGIKDPVAYDGLHVPMPIHKALLLEAWDKGKHLKVCYIRSLYGNLASIGGVSYDNAKCHQDYEYRMFLSTSDNGFANGEVGSYIRGCFPEKSPYEQ